MKKDTFTLIENYMLSCCVDSAHDQEHVYRVLYTAVDIARSEPHVDHDVLICACLLHDIGRQEQFENPEWSHAQVGADKAFRFLLGHQFAEAFAERVRACIQTHRFRQNNPPQGIEARILFDADKIDVSGAIGIARTLVYKGQVSEPLYSLLPNGRVSDGSNDKLHSFFQEYKYKLENLYSRFYTKRGEEIAKQRQAAAVSFYESMLQEVRASYESGAENLRAYID